MPASFAQYKRLVLAIAGLLAAATAGSLPLGAVQCGDTVTDNLVLTWNLGPCTGNGLVVSRSNITIDLNGFHIQGTGAPGSYGITAAAGPFELTVIGPGTISNFEHGIHADGRRVTIQHVTLVDNTYGIVGAAIGFKILNNTIRGEGHGAEGISVGNPKGGFNSASIQGNRVTGHTGAGMNLRAGSFELIDNTIVKNGLGVRASWGWPGYMVGLRMVENIVSRNSGDGVSFVSWFSGSLDMKDNRITHNRGSGVTVGNISTLSSSGVSIDENTVTHNAGSGISIGGRAVRGQVTENRVLHNGVVDLYLFSSPTVRVCYRDNVFRTSDPSPLPACPANNAPR